MERGDSLAIIIVNWNSGQQLKACLESIYSSDGSSNLIREIVVIDNASSDGSADMQTADKVPIKIIHNRANVGFAAACNQGFKYTTSEYILFLNPDVQMDGSDLSHTVEFMARAGMERIGICGIVLKDEKGNIHRSCCRFPQARHFIQKALGLDQLYPKIFRPYLMTEWAHSNSQYVDHVIGAFYLVRRQVFEKLNGFDERYFVYLEDLDFSYRAYKAGWKTYYLADTGSFHKGGGSSETIKSKRLFYSLKSRIIYGHKHFNGFLAICVTFTTLCVEPFIRFVYLILRRSSLTDYKDIWFAYGMLWLSLLRDENEKCS